jgi:1-phosphatidylinositol-4-phosphate 5-kinase
LTPGGPLESERSEKEPRSILKGTPKSKEQQSNIPAKVKNISFAHENFNLVFNIMLGIKKAIDSTFDFEMMNISDKDFKIKCKYEIAPFRTEQKDNVKACTFYDYAPQVFSDIRKHSKISKQSYSSSLGPENIISYMFSGNFQSLAELCSSGKSGSFFYYTANGKFVLKTMKKKEFKFFKTFLKTYHTHLTVNNPESLISRLLGLHKVIFYRKKGKKAKKIYFCIMENVFNTHKKIHLRYDLKGST